MRATRPCAASWPSGSTRIMPLVTASKKIIRSEIFKEIWGEIGRIDAIDR